MIKARLQDQLQKRGHDIVINEQPKLIFYNENKGYIGRSSLRKTNKELLEKFEKAGFDVKTWK